jgi:Carbohydrate esterase 2 N-terminal
MVGLIPMSAGNEPNAAADGSGLVRADDSRALYEGRYAKGADGALRLGFPGVVAHLRFRGQALSLKAEASNADSMFDLSVDGGAPTLLRLGPGTATYPLYSGPAGEHVIELTRRNESWRGTCSLQGYLPGSDSVLLAAAPLPGRKLMFIGDSVTCGELTAWTAGGDPKDGINSDARLAYGMILARRLAAQCHLVSYGGRGLIRDWKGIRTGTNAPQFYERALPDDPSALWPPGRFIPDAIGVQLGTNDFSSGIPTEEEFVTPFIAFIFVMDSPIVRDDPAGGPKRTVLHGYLEAVVAAFASPRVRLVPLKHYPGVPGNGHPTGPEHAAMADEIEPVLRSALGW